MITINRRNTVQRAMILDTVREMKNHPTADEVFAKVSEICCGISKATVYRDLNILADDGVILRVAVANAPDRYDLTANRHAHCRCTVCGRVFDYSLRREPELDCNGNDGFNAVSFDIIVNGICKNCMEAKNG